MSRLALLSLVAVAGCNLPALCEDDPSANHFAIDPATGACWEFTSSCDVPADWDPCGSAECTADDDCEPDEVCANGWCTFTCLEDADCVSPDVCVNGACQPAGPPCYSDGDCAWTEYCRYTRGAPDAEAPIGGTCTPNANCTLDTECADGQWCDFTPGSNDCDPSVPGCGVSQGVCSREPRDPDRLLCHFTADCKDFQVCPAEYGVCIPDGGITCTSVCEDVCLTDEECPSAEFRCNNDMFCVTPNSGGVPVPPVCYGWCVPR
jgi:hypothetical protein